MKPLEKFETARASSGRARSHQRHAGSRRRRRPCPGQRHVPDRRASAQNCRRPIFTPASRSIKWLPTKSVISRVFRRWNCRAKRPGAAAIAIPVIPARINTTWPGVRPTAPVAPEANPRLVFERLFGAGSPGAAESKASSIRQQQQRSILDFVLDDARRMQKQLGGRDQQKLDDYLTSVRDDRKTHPTCRAETRATLPIRTSKLLPAFPPVTRAHSIDV